MAIGDLPWTRSQRQPAHRRLFVSCINNLRTHHVRTSVFEPSSEVCLQLSRRNSDVFGARINNCARPVTSWKTLLSRGITHTPFSHNELQPTSRLTSWRSGFRFMGTSCSAQRRHYGLSYVRLRLSILKQYRNMTLRAPARVLACLLVKPQKRVCVRDVFGEVTALSDHACVLAERHCIHNSCDIRRHILARRQGCTCRTSRNGRPLYLVIGSPACFFIPVTDNQDYNDVLQNVIRV